MKNLNRIACLSVLCVLLFSCDKEVVKPTNEANEISNNTSISNSTLYNTQVLDENSFVKITKLDDQQLFNSIASWISLQKISEEFTIGKLDMNTMMVTHLNSSPENEISVIVPISLNSKATSNVILSVAVSNNVVESATIVKTTSANQINQIQYTELDGTAISIATINSQNQDVSYQALKPKTWGQKTADCISDVYSNHGWMSVWASVQSGFIPATAGAIAAGCALKNM